MNKKTIGMIVGGIVILGIIGSAGNEEQDIQQEDNTTTQEQQVDTKQASEPIEVKQEHKVKPVDIMDIQGDDFSVKITSIETSGSNLTINYDYNNESNEDQTPIYKVAFRCYQDGVELDTSYSRDNYKDQDTILAGYSNEGLQDMFKIENKEAPVLIRVEPWVDFCDTILAEYEYTPSTGELVRK